MNKCLICDKEMLKCTCPKGYVPKDIPKKALMMIVTIN